MIPRPIVGRCHECGVYARLYARRLCLPCWHDDAVRERHPMVRDCRNVGAKEDDICGGYESPAEPTDARPGSAEKIAVLTERAAACVALWHEDDAIADPEIEA